MLEFLKAVWIVVKWLLFEFAPQILGADLGIIGDLLDGISILEWLFK